MNGPGSSETTNPTVNRKKRLAFWFRSGGILRPQLNLAERRKTVGRSSGEVGTPPVVGQSHTDPRSVVVTVYRETFQERAAPVHLFIIQCFEQISGKAKSLVDGIKRKTKPFHVTFVSSDTMRVDENPSMPRWPQDIGQPALSQPFPFLDRAQDHHVL